jgi:hypothetical protein
VYPESTPRRRRVRWGSTPHDPSLLRTWCPTFLDHLGWDTLIAGTDTSVVTGGIRWRRWIHHRVRGPAAEDHDLGGRGEDGDFGASDRVVFYALGPDNFRDRFGLAPGGEEFFENPYTKHTMYWLAWGGALPGSPRRMAQVTVTPPGGTTPATETTARVHAERNAEYVPYLTQPGLRTETWFWDVLPTHSLGKRYPVNLPLRSPENISAHIRVWGRTSPDPTRLIGSARRERRPRAFTSGEATPSRLSHPGHDVSGT